MPQCTRLTTLARRTARPHHWSGETTLPPAEEIMDLGPDGYIFGYSAETYFKSPG